MFLKRLIQLLFQIDSAASSTDKQQAEAALSQVSAALQAESNLSEDTKVALLTWARTIHNKLYDVPSKTDTDTDAPAETTPEPAVPPTNPDPDSNTETHPKPAPEPIPTPVPEVGKDPFQYVELSATDGNANKVTLQSALNTGSAIKILTPGTYPLTPPVLIKSQTLDLNGSTIKLNGRKYGGALFFLSGERPSIQNGTIQGSFDEPAVSLSDPNFFEG